ncbi:unnamed protein product, partial [Mesorhabditis belari]|uniref:Uncharacterized protein n=1 Tax=Mesorhabditis belari TaxID=2138241 RepID=A0AAF3J7N4_9BILA
MGVFEQLSVMSVVELELWFAEQKVITAHLYGSNEEQKDVMLKSLGEAEQMMLQQFETKFRIKEKNYKAGVCTKLITNVNEELIKMMEENFAQLQELMQLKTNVANFERKLARSSVSVELAKEEKHRLETTLDHLKEKNANDEQVAMNDMLQAKSLLKKMEDSVNSNANLLNRKKQEEELQRKQRELELLLTEEKTLETLNKRLGDEVLNLQAMPFEKFCVRFAGVMVALSSYKKKIGGLLPRYKEAQALRKLNKSFPSQDGEESVCISQNISMVKFAPKVPSPLAQANRGISDLDMHPSQSPKRTLDLNPSTGSEMQQQQEEASLLEHEERHASEINVQEVDLNNSHRSFVNSDIEVASNNGEQVTHPMDEGDATMDENEGSKKKAEGICKPYMVVRAMNGDEQEMQRQSQAHETQDHEGSMEENEPTGSHQKMFSSLATSEGQSQAVSQFPASQNHSFSNFETDMGGDVQMDDLQGSYNFGQGIAEGNDDFLNFDVANNENLENNGNSSFNFDNDIVNNVLNLSGQPNAGDSFLNFMVNQSGGDASNNAAFDFDFGNIGNNDANGANLSFNLDDINGGMDLTSAAPEEFNFDF